jgi:two-component system LytT family sensor kinase
MGRKAARALLVIGVFGVLAGLSITEAYFWPGYSSEPSSVANPAVLFWAAFRYYLAWAIVAPVILWLSRRVPLATRRWRRALAFHVPVSIAASVPFFALVVALAVAAGQSLSSLASLKTDFWRILLMVNLSVLPLYWLLLGAGMALQVYRDREASRLRAVELRRSLEAAELDALRMKLRPHFLFNTLNTIASLAREHDMDAVGRVIERLGSLLRLSMETGGRQFVTLDEELALVDEQLAIEEIRFKDRLRVIRRIDPASRRAVVPNLILQPIVENAIAHGLSRRLDASLLEISARRDGGDLRIAVRDDGPGLPKGWRFAANAGPGLRNVLERLRALYAGSFGFEIVNSATGGAVAELRLPFTQAQPAVAGSGDDGSGQDGHR